MSRCGYHELTAWIERHLGLLVVLIWSKSLLPLLDRLIMFILRFITLVGPTCGLYKIDKWLFFDHFKGLINFFINTKSMQQS